MSFKIKASSKNTTTEINDPILEIVTSKADMTLLEHTIKPDTDIVICLSGAPAGAGAGGRINLTLPKITKTREIIISNKADGAVNVFVPDGGVFADVVGVGGGAFFVSYFDTTKNKTVCYNTYMFISM